MSFRIVKVGDTHIVSECDINLDDEIVEYRRIPVSLYAATEEELLELVRTVYHDTRLQYKYKTKKAYVDSYNDYCDDSFSEDEDYIPGVDELFE